MALEQDTVQQTLCMPLWARAICAKKQPNLFPDLDAQRILDELDVPVPKGFFYRLQNVNVQCVIRQYDMAQEILAYLAKHPQATIVEMGAGLSCQRRQMATAGMAGTQNPWYAVDLPNVIELRERLVPADGVEQRIAADLNDFSWLDAIDFDPELGIVFIAAGLFYYFRRSQVQALVCELARRFPGGALAFDATCAKGLKGVDKEVELSGIKTDAFFSLEDPKTEIEAWDERLSASERDYFTGYLDPKSYHRTPLTRIMQRVMKAAHLSFIVHVDINE